MSLFSSITKHLSDAFKSIKSSFNYDVSDYKHTDDIDKDLLIDEGFKETDEFITDDYLKEKDDYIDIEHIDYSDTSDYKDYKKVGVRVFEYFTGKIDIFHKPKEYKTSDITVTPTKHEDYELWLVEQTQADIGAWTFFHDLFDEKRGTP